MMIHRIYLSALAIRNLGSALASQKIPDDLPIKIYISQHDGKIYAGPLHHPLLLELVEPIWIPAS